ncbi:zinc finger domain-containing protein [Inquilinus limosus]|uniref:zinc finger domain-containing protein n=1 Tax=Inquilinus limosus TaxID=171674 RepID=UPI003F5CDAC8
MSDPLEHPCRRCGAASYQPCTDRAGHIRREAHARRRQTAQSSGFATWTTRACGPLTSWQPGST